jgi:hypothetical protein
MEMTHTGIIFKIKAEEKSTAFIQAIEKIENQLNLGV